MAASKQNIATSMCKSKLKDDINVHTSLDEDVTKTGERKEPLSKQFEKEQTTKSTSERKSSGPECPTRHKKFTKNTSAMRESSDSSQRSLSPQLHSSRGNAGNCHLIPLQKLNTELSEKHTDSEYDQLHRNKQLRTLSDVSKRADESLNILAIEDVDNPANEDVNKRADERVNILSDEDVNNLANEDVNKRADVSVNILSDEDVNNLANEDENKRANEDVSKRAEKNVNILADEDVNNQADVKMGIQADEYVSKQTDEGVNKQADEKVNIDINIPRLADEDVNNLVDGNINKRANEGVNKRVDESVHNLANEDVNKGAKEDVNNRDDKQVNILADEKVNNRAGEDVNTGDDKNENILANEHGNNIFDEDVNNPSDCVVNNPADENVISLVSSIENLKLSNVQPSATSNCNEEDAYNKDHHVPEGETGGSSEPAADFDNAILKLRPGYTIFSLTKIK